jgi:DUF4097 and DUF4098 domain-containing protein YvlB
MRANFRRKHVLGLTCALAFAASAVASDRIKLTAEFHQTYPLAANGRVALENINGAVHITAWDRNEVKVDAIKSAYTQESLDEAKIEVNASSDRVSIHTKYPDRHWDNYDENRPANVEYTLTVPRAVRIDEVKLVNGGLDITGVTGEVRASLVNGALKAGGLSGPLKLSTVNGRIDVALDRLSNSPLEISSVNGHLLLTLPSNAKAELEVSTVNGGISNDFGLRVHKHRYVGADMRGQLAGGGTRIRLSDVNGGIEVRHANDSQTLSPAKDMNSSEDDDADTI